MSGFVRYGERNVNLDLIVDILKSEHEANKNKTYYIFFYNGHSDTPYSSWIFDNELERDRAFNLLLEHMTNIEL